MILLLMTILCAQDPAAAEAFHKIEESLATAKGVSIRANVSTLMDIGGVPNDHAGSIVILLKPENKAYMNARLYGINSHIVFTLVSDGSKLSLKSPGASWKQYDTPKDLHRRLATVIGQTGTVHPVYFSAYAFDAATSKEFAPGYQVSDLKLGAGGKDGALLSYKLSDDDGTLAMKVTFEPTTHRLLNVAAHAENSKVRSSDTVHFEKWDLETIVPDRIFTLPIPGRTEEESIDKAKDTLKQLRKALEAYSEDNDVYPTTEQGLEALVEKPKKDPIPKEWSRPYLKGTELLKDPWGNPYGYRRPGKDRPRGFDLFSYGPDGKPDTSDDIH